MNTQTPLGGTVRLSHLGVIRARGPDATAFLQGQLTNDVATLGVSEVRLAGFCSAKGRLQASFVVWKAGPDDILLACAASLLPATLKRLSMFVLRAKCKLSDATAEVPLLGLLGTPAQHAENDMRVWEKRDTADGALMRLPAAGGVSRCILAAPTSESERPHDAAVSLDHWRWLEVQSGVPTIEAATVDQFVPQMLNLEVLGGVDFKKGCYPGQEVVARSQYRGILKRRMFLFDCEVPAAPGMEVFHGSDPGQPAGMVVNAAPGPDGIWSALVEAKISALESGILHLGARDGAPLRVGQLPYALP